MGVNYYPEKSLPTKKMRERYEVLHLLLQKTEVVKTDVPGKSQIRKLIKILKKVLMIFFY